MPKDVQDLLKCALHGQGETLLTPSQFHPEWQLVHEYGLGEALPAMTHVWQVDANTQWVAIKGAPETVAALPQLSVSAAQDVAAESLAMAAQVLAAHAPIAGLSMLPLLMGWPGILTPVHIAFLLEPLISPICPVVFETEEEENDQMQRYPRDQAIPFFSRSLIVLSVSHGLLVLEEMKRIRYPAAE